MNFVHETIKWSKVKVLKYKTCRNTLYLTPNVSFDKVFGDMKLVFVWPSSFLEVGFSSFHFEAISIVCHKVHHIFLFGNKNRWTAHNRQSQKRRVFLCYQPIILHMCCPNIFAALQWAKSGFLVKPSHMPNWIEKLIYFPTFWVKYIF